MARVVQENTVTPNRCHFHICALACVWSGLFYYCMVGSPSLESDDCARGALKIFTPVWNCCFLAFEMSSTLDVGREQSWKFTVSLRQAL
ncbi:hypothetical protein BDV38DRAFT_11123 [Aspergillus pseudotamarii]|uniref:Uncharacterized protein n=1 Tax=Aspergillus pseudotamarii TaxID=132259 RepID=A0A5N6T3P1_ASPPS|nr:uncharacterized protein BDV38DRAFT_11123 [Aspergillus pseudotamarii]KAE8140923.1 hypothetical protein BDV38DRAFT_11123 [Aspergillus pseudotamarii]